MKYKAASLIFFVLIFTCLLALPAQAQSDSQVEANAAFAKPTKKPAKTKKPQSTPVRSNSATPVPTQTNTPIPSATATATHTSNPAFSATPSQTPSSTGTATNTFTPTNMPDEDQPTRTKSVPASNATSTVSIPSVVASLSSSSQTSTAAQTVTPATDLTPMFAGGLAITLPTDTPATPWLQTVLAEVTQTAVAAYKSPTPSFTFTPTATFTATATSTVTATAVVAGEHVALNVNSAATPAVQSNNTLFWMILYAVFSLGFVAVLFMAYLKLVVFRNSA